MKRLFLLLFSILYVNLALASRECIEMFADSPRSKNLVENDTTLLPSLIELIKKLEYFGLEEYAPSKVATLEFPELKNDLKNQLAYLKNARAAKDMQDTFALGLLDIQIVNVGKALNKPINLNQHFLLSLQTLMVLDQKVKSYDLLENTSKSMLTHLQKVTLEKFIKNQIDAKGMIRAFPKIRVFVWGWQKFLEEPILFRERVPLFSSLKLPLPEFNKTLSPAQSFIGIIDHPENPDRVGLIAPLRYAFHDYTHHELYRHRHRDWGGVMDYYQRAKFLIEIRKNYLAVRSFLKPKEALSLDILYFDFLHEDTDILARFALKMKQSDGVFYELYTLASENVFSLRDVRGIMTSAKDVYPLDIKESNLDDSSIEALAKSAKPYWELMSKIWVLAYHTSQKTEGD